jgi:hypothetical protein
LKAKYFGDDVDDPVVLHREEIVKKVGPFGVLKDSATKSAFEQDLLGLIERTHFKAFAVVIDKLNTATRYYGLANSHPYHIGLLTMLERYCGCLNFERDRGDVMAESRGGREDSQLKAAYREIFTGGTSFRRPAFFQGTLSSGEIKLKSKAANTPGLQLADLLAHAAKKDLLARNGRCKPLSGFAFEIGKVLEKKYNRRYANGQVRGYGTVFLQ